MILLIGLAVGIDYSLFYLRRVTTRSARRGRTPAEALQVAAATSGRAVLISGLTVMIAMAGMFLMGSQIFTSFGIGTVLVVAVALVGSLTVLPAVLARLGDRVDRGQRPGPEEAPRPSRRVALLGGDRRRGAAPTSHSRRRAPLAAARRARDPRVQPAHRRAGLRRGSRATSRS